MTLKVNKFRTNSNNYVKCFSRFQMETMSLGRQSFPYAAQLLSGELCECQTGGSLRQDLLFSIFVEPTDLPFFQVSAIQSCNYSFDPKGRLKPSVEVRNSKLVLPFGDSVGGHVPSIYDYVELNVVAFARSLLGDAFKKQEKESYPTLRWDANRNGPFDLPIVCSSHVFDICSIPAAGAPWSPVMGKLTKEIGQATSGSREKLTEGIVCLFESVRAVSNYMAERPIANDPNKVLIPLVKADRCTRG
ncbi:MAG: hypothetical protein AB7E52_00350 [Bdellovibrionales bacterium]